MQKDSINSAATNPKANGFWSSLFQPSFQQQNLTPLPEPITNGQTSIVTSSVSVLPSSSTILPNNPNIPINPSKPKTYHTVPGILSKRKLTLNQARSRIALIRKYALWMDAIPGLPIQIGLDGILGLIPGVGDISTGFLSLILLWLARDLDLPKPLVMKMLGNIGIDTLVGSVPVVGDIFDIMWKANIKNIDLIEEWFEANINLFENDDSLLP